MYWLKLYVFLLTMETVDDKRQTSYVFLNIFSSLRGHENGH